MSYSLINSNANRNRFSFDLGTCEQRYTLFIYECQQLIW